MHRKHNQPPEYPPTPIHKLTTFRTHFGDEGVTPSIPAVKLTDRDRRVLELENQGYTLAQTFVLPSRPESPGNIGNVRIIPEEAEQLATNGILIAWATERMAAAALEYGAGNVAICRDMRFPPPEESAYESHEYMALYVRYDPEYSQ